VEDRRQVPARGALLRSYVGDRELGDDVLAGRRIVEPIGAGHSGVGVEFDRVNGHLVVADLRRDPDRHDLRRRRHVLVRVRIGGHPLGLVVAVGEAAAHVLDGTRQHHLSHDH
jgi:hypothetical protein